MALQFLIFDLTGDIYALAILAIAEAIPMILIGPFAGVVVDRFDRKYVMATANFFQAIIIFLIPISTIFPISTRVGVIIGLAFLNSGFSRFFFPSRGASIPKLIDDKDDLFAANSLTAGVYQMSVLIGPMLAGLIIGAFGYEIPFIIDSISFVVSSISILLITISLKPEKKSKENPLQDLITGARFIQDFPPIFYILVIFSLIMFAGGASLFLIVPYLEIEFGLVEQGAREFVYGLLTAMSAGVGMSLAIYLSKKKRISKPITLITYSLVIVGWILVGFGVAQNLWMLALAWIGFGTIEVVIGIPLQTVTQETVPDQLRGKVFSFLNLTMTIFQIIGMGVVSILALSFDSLRSVFIFNGIVLIICAIFGILWLRAKSLEDIAQRKRDEFYSLSSQGLMRS
jgi:MFS family permease